MIKISTTENTPTNAKPINIKLSINSLKAITPQFLMAEYSLPLLTIEVILAFTKLPIK